MDDASPTTTPPAVPHDLRAACRDFFPEATDDAIAALLGYPALVKVETPRGTMRVRRWPPHAVAADVAFGHRVMAAARETGLSVVPCPVSLPDDGDTVLRRDGALYDAQQWLPGSPPPRAEARWPDPPDRFDLPATIPQAAFSDAIATVAALHAATADLAQEPGAPAAPLAMLPGAVAQAHHRHYGTLRARAVREPTIQRWLATSERLLATATPIVLEATQQDGGAVAPLHLGLWPAHILLSEGNLSGLLGWERVAVGSPLLDLAQAILRLQGWTDDIVETTIGAYSATQPLAPAERRLLPAVAALDAVASTGRLLEQTFVPGIGERPPTAVRGAIDMMLRSLIALDHGLTTPERKHRQWTPSRQAGRPRGPAKGARPRERRR